ncbi:MAG TPA: SDR family oxidoreductase [Myxococcaceae bacterium]|nr:SDR family oxidoreductase [Myxococcaceae bacterium]
MKRFESKVVLVLGGNAGIGRAAAEAFAREGAKVVVAARREEQGVAVVQAIQEAGGTAKFIRADVAREADVKAAVEGTVKEFGQLDVLFNNAGIEGKNGPIGTLGGADFDETFGVNVKGTWLGMKHALPHLAKTRGSIVNNSSVVADVGFADFSIYSATKGAVNALTRAAAMEFIPQGVRVNAVAPGPIETDMASRVFGGIEGLRAVAKQAVPAGVPGAVEDIAAAVLYLASPESSFVVGQVLTVDGGLTVR